ncbi:right-handed parallel beta-helix repeat-containing protein, partial [Micromonospora musae]|uniref:right-handed parallel beta-helix repeat-containing protein n=1 Tax=Micromonospora musae TaxID=1894970 RepID=UPI00340E2B33
MRAVDPAADDTPAVTVRAGAYTERLVVDRPLKLIAAGSAGDVRVIGVAGPALTVSADAGTVQGLRVEAAAGEFALVIERGSMVVEDCEILGDVRISADATPTLRRCRVTGGTLFLEDASQAILEGCVLAEAHRDGLVVRGDAAPTVSRTRIDGPNGNGILFADSARGALTDCEITRPAGAGVTVRGTAAPALRELTVREPGGDGFRIDGLGDGVPVRAGGGVVLEKCAVVRPAGTGVIVSGSAAVLLRETTVSEPAEAGVLAADGSEVHLEGCTIRRSATSALVARDRASVVADRLVLDHADGNGLLAEGTASVRMSEPEIGHTGRSAVHVAGRAEVTMLGGVLHDTSGFGLRVVDEAMAVADGTEITEAATAGIGVENRGD